MVRKVLTIAIAGASGSGKSRITKEVAKLLNGTALFFDDYSHLMQVKDINDFPSYKITRMVLDLKKIIRGEKIINPKSGKEVSPSKYIIIEDPYGRLRKDITSLYDFVVLIDTPLEICLARVILRIFDSEKEKRSKYWKNITDEDAEEILQVIERHVSGEWWTRDWYIAINNEVRKNVDLIIDGMDTPNEIAKFIIQEIDKK